MLFHDDDDHEPKQSDVKTPPKTKTTFSWTKDYRKWKLRDLLFRSALEDRSTDKVALDTAMINYAILTKSKSQEAAANFRSSSDGSSSMKGVGSGGRNSGGVPVSAHGCITRWAEQCQRKWRERRFYPTSRVCWVVSVSIWVGVSSRVGLDPRPMSDFLLFSFFLSFSYKILYRNSMYVFQRSLLYDYF